MSSERNQTPIDREIARLAAVQHGVVALRQLGALGLGVRAVTGRVASGRLQRIHAGVYAVGHACMSADGKRMAAVLACGLGAALSYRDAADIHGLRRSSDPRIDVTSPIRTGRKKQGIRVHSGATLTPGDITTVRAIPCTNVSRTLLDLAEVVSQRQLERAIDRAEILRVFDLRAVHELLERSPGRRGARKLQRAIAADPVLTRNELEEAMYALCRKARLPKPEPDYPIGQYTADFCWPDQRLIAETDGRRTHLTTHAFEHDRRRDQELAVAGWRVVRFTYRQVMGEPEEVAATLRALLA
jgi:very-short-patch-repair endonuclease